MIVFPSVVLAEPIIGKAVGGFGIDVVFSVPAVVRTDSSGVWLATFGVVLFTVVNTDSV